MMRPFTGWHMATIMIAFFGVVIVVNLVMARFAVTTFGGTVVDNSYVASQKYNGWLEAARRQQALGWDVTIGRDSQKRVTVAVSKDALPLPGASVMAVARHPLGRQPERRLRLISQGGGRFVASEPLPIGRWQLVAIVRADNMEARFLQDLSA